MSGFVSRFAITYPPDSCSEFYLFEKSNSVRFFSDPDRTDKDSLLCSLCGRPYIIHKVRIQIVDKQVEIFHQKHYCVNGTSLDFHCQCGQIFESQKTLAYHLNFDCGQKSFPDYLCQCGKDFDDELSLMHHLANDCDLELSLDFICTCGKHFKDRDTLGVHQTECQKEPKKSFICWCGKQYADKEDLIRHRDKDCSMEQKRNKSKNERNSVENAPSTEWYCNCGNLFDNQDELFDHLADCMIIKRKKYVCKHCRRQFENKAICNNHVTICEAGLVKDKCAQSCSSNTIRCECGYFFKNVEHRRRHKERFCKLRFSGDTPLPTSKESATTENSSELKKKEETLLKCQCGKVFKFAIDLAAHSKVCRCKTFVRVSKALYYTRSLVPKDNP